jgi:hypothetical protein
MTAIIGAGRKGEVYKARDTRVDRMVAIKVSTTEYNERSGREARAIATLNHVGCLSGRPHRQHRFGDTYDAFHGRGADRDAWTMKGTKRLREL